jgi:hypothetical protein
MAVGIQKATGFVEQTQQGIGIGIPKVLSQDQEIPAFFQRRLRDIEEASFVGSSLSFEPFGNISRHRDCRSL